MGKQFRVILICKLFSDTLDLCCFSGEKMFGVKSIFIVLTIIKIMRLSCVGF